MRFKMNDEAGFCSEETLFKFGDTLFKLINCNVLIFCFRQHYVQMKKYVQSLKKKYTRNLSLFMRQTPAVCSRVKKLRCVHRLVKNINLACFACLSVYFRFVNGRSSDTTLNIKQHFIQKPCSRKMSLPFDDDVHYYVCLSKVNHSIKYDIDDIALFNSVILLFCSTYFGQHRTHDHGTKVVNK